MTPQNIVQEANSNALALLKKTGCIYNVIDSFGNTFSNKVVTRPKVYDWSDLEITEKIRAAKPGDTIEFPAKGRPLRNLSSIVSGKASRVLGLKKHRVTQDVKRQTVTLTIKGIDSSSDLDQALRSLGMTNG